MDNCSLKLLHYPPSIFSFIVFSIVVIILLMSRSQPYRARMPVHVMQLLDVASRITLFLVGQAGPLSFTFKDRLDNKYRTQIGPDLRCSCSPQRNDHCIHTAYVLLRIFRLSADNPLIWQGAYVDSQLEDLLAGKHTQAQQPRPRPRFPEMPEELPQQLPSDWLRHKEQREPETRVERLALGVEAVCPICQEEMLEEMSLSWCRTGCGNNFHLECLKVWGKHRQQEGASVNCPMCRARFPPCFLTDLENEEREYARRQSDKIKVVFNCAGCGLKGIPSAPHKCLLCSAFELCQPCYAGGKHIKHPFVRQEADGRWRGAEERRSNELKLKSYIDSKRKESFNDEMLRKLRKIEEDPNKMLDFAAAAYPYVSRYISDHIDPLRKMDFEAADLKCQVCMATKMLFLRRLNCGHFIDHECLKNCLIKDKFYCQHCGSQFLKGLQNLRQREKENQIKRDQQLLSFTPQFDPSPLEREEVRESYNFVSEEPTLTQILSSRGPSGHGHEQIRSRIASNIIRQHRTPSRQPTPQLHPQQHSRPPRPEIRVRNVVSKGKSEGRALSNAREQPAKKKKEELQFMIEALVGRKLK